MTHYSELSTIRDFIRYATTRFNEAALYYGHGTDNAWDEASSLVLHTLHLPHDINPTVLDAHLIREEQTALLKLIDDRVTKRIPVPYLTHEAWFAGLSFYVDERVLIPRSPIAELIENQFAPWIAADHVHTILDLCTGSGCIAIACAKAFPEAEVDGSDVSAEALAVAKINVLRHSLEEQVHLHESDLFASLPKKKYDIIVSNPPYVDAEDFASLPPEYLHEPRLGLAGGKEGIDFAMRILEQARDYLQPHGILVLEVGNSEVALAERLPHVPFTWMEFERGGGGVFMLTGEQLEEIS
ncbi:MAG: 50S ribosomal protein L3 N(5)-glutamine methyltransferase [Gammaproteobacteria bacterium]|nr:MAG: 50S ribosomal protein L3 N(5)-glutamine methyltransferase [Gammaproteobacteria bacterium]